MRYRDASRLAGQEEGEQVNTLVYTLGEQAEDIILARGINEDTHDNVIRAFDDYFGVRTNTIVERAKFNKLTQCQDGMDTFIHKLYRQAEYCAYGALREELIRDRLVVGVSDDRLSEKLQSEADLTLANAVAMCRRFEAAKEAQPVVRANISGTGAVDMVKGRRTNNRRGNNYNTANKPKAEEYRPHTNPASKQSSSKPTGAKPKCH